MANDCCGCCDCACPNRAEVERLRGALRAAAEAECKCGIGYIKCGACRARAALEEKP
jgi:hypothetical protein